MEELDFESSILNMEGLVWKDLMEGLKWRSDCLPQGRMEDEG